MTGYQRRLRALDAALPRIEPRRPLSPLARRVAELVAQDRGVSVDAVLKAAEEVRRELPTTQLLAERLALVEGITPEAAIAQAQAVLDRAERDLAEHP
jgi:hypothetical protein